MIFFFIGSFSVYVLWFFLPPPLRPPLASRRLPSTFGGFLCPWAGSVRGVGGPPRSPLYLGTEGPQEF